MWIGMGLFLQNELKRGIYGKSAKIKNRISNNLSNMRRLENSGVLTANPKVTRSNRVWRANFCRYNNGLQPL